MNTKLLTSIGCLLLMVVANAPSVLGHSERPYLVGDLGSGYTGPPTGFICPNGAEPACHVSGRYIGSAGAAVAIEAYNNPQGTIVPLNASRYCDFEVFVDSNDFYTSEAHLNEQQIDGTYTYWSTVMNNWDDGGQGGACHTGHYTTPGFNTFGCQPGTQVSGGTHTGTDIWVGAMCDWKAVWEAPSSSDVFVQCLWSEAVRPFHPLVLLSPNFDDVNVIVEGRVLEDWQLSPGWDLPAFQGELAPFENCSQEFADCLLTPACVADSVEICGNDGTPDAIIYGYAGVGSSMAPARFPMLGWPPYIVNGNPPVAFPCPYPDEVAAIYVFDTVVTYGGGVNNPGTVDVYPALTGEVFSVPSTIPSWSTVFCTEAAATNPIVFQVSCYYDYNRICTAWVSVWNPVTFTQENTCEPS